MAAILRDRIAVEEGYAHFPTSAAYGLLSEAVPDGIRAYLAALDEERNGP